MHSDAAKSNARLSKADHEIAGRPAREIQWDYENIVRRKGRLERLAP